MHINWEQFIIIDRSEVLDQLTHQYIHTGNKLVVRGYTVKASGTAVNPQALADTLSRTIPYYVYGKALDPKELVKKTLNAVKFFGKKNPDTDGKYGELFLYWLVESVLGCKMIAHKIRTLTNTVDQVKGGDGIFMGNYYINSTTQVNAYLIGESKVTKTFANALEEAYKSIDRFHTSISSARFMTTELMIAADNLFTDDSMSIDELDEIYKRLTPSTDEYKSQVIVHPILIMYDSAKISNCEIEAMDNIHLEKLLTNKLFGSPDYHDKISKKLNEYSQLKKYYLDFFIIPHSSIKDFRNYMYYSIHGVEFNEN